MRTNLRARQIAFSVSAREFDAVLQLTFRGEMDLHSAQQCAVDLEEPLEGSHQIVLVDLSEVTFIDSIGLQLLIRLKQQTEVSGRDLMLTEVSPAVARLLQITGLVASFEYLDGAQERNSSQSTTR